MKRIFRPRNLLILFTLGVVIGIVMSKKNSAPAPTYPDPWAKPASDPAAGNGESADATGSNGSSAAAETTSQSAGS